METVQEVQARVAERIAELRKQAGLTQQQVAERAGMQPSNYQRIEYGGQNLTIETLVKIAQAIGVSVNEFWLRKRGK